MTTIVDLRNLDEVAPLPIPASVARFSHPIEDQDDAGFMSIWGDRLNSPAYYAASLELWPDLVSSVFQRFAAAQPGGIVFHCSAGRDRTGLIAAMLLQLVGVDHDAIVDDYAMSVGAMNDYYAVQQRPRERPRTSAEQAEWLDVVLAQLNEFLEGVSSEKFLLQNGLSKTELDHIRNRLREPRLRRTLANSDPLDGLQGGDLRFPPVT